MNIPPEIQQWLEEKAHGRRWAGVLQHRSVTHEYFKAFGGRNMRAGVSMSIAPAETFSLSFPNDAQCAEFIPAVKDGLISILLGQGLSPILRCAVKFESLVIHEIDSCDMAFFRASREATEQLLGLAPAHEPNISWW